MPNPGRLHIACLAGIAAAALAAVLAWAAPVESSRPARPQRIVSLNLCTDQLVLALADREQIAGLTRNAADADMSAEASRARGLRILGSSAEEILELEPDLVVGMPARRSPAVRMLAGQSYQTLDLKPANTLEDVFVSIRETAAAVGHPERGDALIARMRQDLARIPWNGGGKVAVYYQRRGYMTGTGTLVDDLMKHVGLVNLAASLRKSPLSQVSLEEIVAARPDYLIVESATDRITDQGTEMLHHPALAGIPRLSIPEAWTVCGSPAYVRAARGLSEQMAASRNGRR
jgi:iron complex transport system substrate-binding protein